MDSEINYYEYRKRSATPMAPGGAYAVRAIKESEPVAIRFMQMGYQIFVLKYSAGSDHLWPEKGIIKFAVYPLQAVEMLEALHIVKEHADEWSMDKNRIFLMGLSAGGHVRASCGVWWNDPVIAEQLSFRPKKDELKAAGIVLGYSFLVPNSNESFKKHPLEAIEKVQHTMSYALYQLGFPSQKDVEEVSSISYVSQDTAPTFLWHSTDDPVIDAGNSIRFTPKLLEYGIPTGHHLFGHGEHGKALENSLTYKRDEMTDHHLNSWTFLTDYRVNRIGEK